MMSPQQLKTPVQLEAWWDPLSRWRPRSQRNHGNFYWRPPHLILWVHLLKGELALILCFSLFIGDVCHLVLSLSLSLQHKTVTLRECDVMYCSVVNNVFYEDCREQMAAGWSCVCVCFNDDSVYMCSLCVLALNGGRERVWVVGWGEGNGGWFVCGLRDLPLWDKTCKLWIILMHFFFCQRTRALIPQAVEMKIVYVFFQTLPPSLVFFFFLVPDRTLQPAAV